MIRSLKLENFRRHENTELEFAPDSQLVAITGRNGAGKTTILEALLWAFYGESRHGRRQLAGLVRRGAEHEGMCVTAEFTVAGTLYRIERRLEKGKHSAALYANHTLHTQTAEGVTKAVTALFGMDIVGFKLATIAKQKELDGLAKMEPSVRRRTVGRMLRLDSVQAAAGSARDQHNSAKTSAAALAGAASVAERTTQLEEARTAAGEAKVAYDSSVAAVADLDARIGAASGAAEAYHTAQLALSRAEAHRDSARAERDRVAAEAAAHRVPDPVPAPEVPLAQLRDQLADVDALIARGQAQEGLAAQLAAARRRVAETNTLVEKVTGQLADVTAVDPETVKAQTLTALGAAESRRQQLVTDVEETVTVGTETRTRLNEVVGKLDGLDGLGAVCDACGQDVPEDHKHAQVETFTASRDQLATDLDRLQTQVTQQRTDLATVEQQIGTLRSDLAAVEQQLARRDNLTGQLADVTRRAEVYTEEVTRLEGQVEQIDLDVAYATKTELEAARAEAEEAEHAALVREAAVAKAADLTSRVAEADQRLAAAEDAVAAATPPAEVVEAWQTHQRLVAEREAEREMLEHLGASAAAAEAKVAGVQQLLADASAVAEKVDRFRTRAEVAAKTATLLEQVAKRMATQIRPQLEAQVSSLLAQMSDGRFATVKISDEYEVTVCDHDGRFYPVGEFSGGEADLVALAIRLALAQVVTMRHGAGGTGFLILDEVFGSQDDGRRLAILEALRKLRGTYGQILLISHVGGIEDVSDLVLDVGKDDDDEIARVAVLT